MKLTRHFSEAIANLMSTKLRTFLAVLGILVGTASVVAMISGGKLATRQALQQFKALGTNLLSVQINQNSSNQAPSSDNEELDLNTILAIKNQYPEIREVAPYTNIYVPITYNGTVINGGILGVTSSMKTVMKVKMQSGRFVSFVDNYENYCVIGQTVYQSIKAISLQDPIGQQIDVNGNFFTIIGVAKYWEPNSFIYSDLP